MPAPHIQSHATDDTTGIAQRIDAGVGATGSAGKGDFGDTDVSAPERDGCTGAIAGAGGTGAVRCGIADVMGVGGTTDCCG